MPIFIHTLPFKNTTVISMYMLVYYFASYSASTDLTYQIIIHLFYFYIYSFIQLIFQNMTKLKVKTELI